MMGCTTSGGPEMSTEEELTWSTVKSPITGRCYEAATLEVSQGHIVTGYMGMSEIPCTEMR